MKCALMGFGRIGKIHLKNILEHKNFELQYVYDHNIKKLEELQKSYENIIMTTSMQTILENKEIQVVFICTPSIYHHSHITLCLSNNKHVFCEKPLCLELQQIDYTYKLANDKNLFLFCGFNRRYDPPLIDLKDKIMSGKIGNVFKILTISRDDKYPSMHYLKKSKNIFFDSAIHNIDFTNWLLNSKPHSVYVNSLNVKYPKLNNNFCDNVCILLNYPKNIVVNINCCRISEYYDQRVEVYGDKGSLYVNNPVIENTKHKDYSFEERYEKSYLNELNYFYNNLNNTDAYNSHKKDNIDVFKILEACEKSLNQSKKIIINYKNDGFRNYTNVQDAVKNTYFKNRKYQTLEYVTKMHQKYLTFQHKMKITDVFKYLENFIDISDPDINLPNYHHAIQTAEGIRNDGHPEWMQVVGLIHDIGKIIFKWGCDEDGTSIKEQWGMVGDTFIVGCRLPDNIVYPEFNNINPDMQNSLYNTKLGIYEKNCGLDNVICSWGHDEYLYQVLKNCEKQNRLPEEAYYMIRFHSLYSYHQNGEYKQFVSEKDEKMFKWLKLFNKYDLYTKKNEVVITHDLVDYYNKLIYKFFDNGELFF